MIELAKDSIANYVVNKAIEVMENDMFEEFVEVISSSRDELVCYVATFFEFVNSQSICLLNPFYPSLLIQQSKSQYGKYVLQKMDKRNKAKA